MIAIRRWSTPGLLVLALGLSSHATGPREAWSDEPIKQSEQKLGRFVDAARMVDPGLIPRVDEELNREARRAMVPVLIETVESLDGRTIQEAVARKEFAAGTDGIYVLLAEKERKIEVQVAFRFQNRIDHSAIRQAFIAGLRQGPEEGINSGVRAITRALRALDGEAPDKVPSARPEKPRVDDGEAPDKVPSARPEKPRAEESKPRILRSDSPLVVRNQVKLALSGAKRIIEGAEAKAREMNLKVNIAVVDDGGHLLSFSRMDGARPASGYTAITKASTAATFRQETGPLPRGAAAPDPLLNLSLQNAAAASGGKLTTLFGGVPVLIDDQVVAGVGVGGGSGEQDAVVAKAGIEAFLNELKGSSSTSTPSRSESGSR